MKNLLRALSYFRPDKWRLVVVFLLMLASIGLNVLKPWPLAIIVDSVLGTKPLPSWSAGLLEHWSKNAWLGILGAGIFLIHFAQGAFSSTQNFLSINVGLRGLTRVRNEVFDKLQRLSLRYHQAANPGDLIYRASWDTFAFQTLFQQGLVTFATAFLSLVLMVSVMVKLNGRLTLAALALVPLLVLVIKIFGNRMGSRAAAAQQADSSVTSLVQQAIAAMPLIQSYTREEFEKKRFGDKVNRAQKTRSSQHGSELLYWFCLAVLFGAGATLITWLGANEVLANRLTVGELLIFLAYLAQLYEPLNQLSHVGATVSGATAGTRRVFEILDAREEVAEKSGAAAILEKGARGDIEFQNVSFGYAADRGILHDVNLSVRTGECVAIVGPSGAGKSTFLNLIPRFFDPDHGAIRLDGTDLREFRLRDLRSQIALVLQQPIILPGTIAENIAYGKPGALPEQIQEAARLANAHEFIQRFPHGYETIVGDGAARLSIGEQQRINLARAFLKDAPVLLLDEPTSALDAESEALVSAGLARLMQGRTTFIVAHRFNVVQKATKIVVLVGGRIAECGSPQDLLGRGGYFTRLSREFQSTESPKKT